MTDRQQFPESDPRHHTIKIKRMLRDTADHAREDVAKVDDAQARALMETTAEVLLGLHKAYEDYEQQSERAWKR
ncbi:hypothetical protein QOZ88_01675 [Blastococcus sp. BMG 814]|uniref:Uncharacterized protein n=1 Tax=Blastococcus carthaginiensis TaxID=3050034 RepID=A0ABT9I6Z3_9ACTN|nr:MULTISPECIES: hypothetical protein [Blastococcus]MDP5181335.1 hypothetical protein [Blastococcus carthaginiensis]SEL32809.1 hypothetical protein SAMN04515665_11153 [Blastococcus sp. DSM 46786]